MTAVPSGERTIALSHTIQTAAAAASAPSTPIPASPAPSEPRVRGGATAGAAIVVLESKVQVPALRPGTVSRTALVNRLRATTTVPVTTVVAPAGYGKTTLLSQWADRDSRPFAWVTLDDRDNDPVVLLRHIAAALLREGRLDDRVIDALRAPAPSVWSAAVPRLAAELSARSPSVLVLDDFNLLRSRSALETIAALSIRDGEQTGGPRARFGGDDRYLADYFHSEYLSRLRPGPLDFLRRTSVLDRMCGALCDAVLEDEGSGRELEKIERANLFLVPLDDGREWYCYLHLFRERLQ